MHSAIVDRPGVDVFGNPPAKKQLECICPHCQRNLAASRFAPHLEKCMGMGRNSSRIARRTQKVQQDRLLLIFPEFSICLSSFMFSVSAYFVAKLISL